MIKFTIALIVLCASPVLALADTWAENKQGVEWAFKLGSVSVALEKCPFKKGPRFAELEKNARDTPAWDGMRTLKEGREMMMILDGPDKSALCGTSMRFYGKTGRDLPGVLEIKDAPAAP